MRNFLTRLGLVCIWRAAGKLGRDLVAWIELAEKQGFSGRQAFDFVWRKAKSRYHDVGDWLLNLLIETQLARRFKALGQLGQRLKWPGQG
jgi:hypothetical protein